jgi:hypothetical protein
MVHRTDITRGSTGQVSPGNDGVCRHPSNGALLEKAICPNLCLFFYSGGKNCRRLFMTETLVMTKTLGPRRH